jgi:hypothetical protein
MTTITIHLPESDAEVIDSISGILKNVKGSRISVDSDEDTLTDDEVSSLKASLKEVDMIKSGKLKPLSMNDLWDN